MIKKTIKILIPMCFFLLPIYSGVHAAAIKDTVSSDPFKTWTVKFSQKINLNKTEIINFIIKKDLTDNEIKDVLKNIEDNTIKMCYSRNNDKILYAEGKSYLPFTDEFNSEEKVYKFLRNYYTDKMTGTMMKYLGTRYVDDYYAELCGDWGESTDWGSITITNKHYLDSNTLQFTCDFFDQNNYSVDNKLTPKHNYSTYKLKYADGRWLVDYNSNFK